MSEIAYLIAGLICMAIFYVYIGVKILTQRFHMTPRPITRNKGMDALKARVYGNHKRTS